MVCGDFFVVLPGLGGEEKEEGQAVPMICQEEGRTLTVQVEGEVDHHRAKEIMEELDRRVDAALPKTMILDLGGVGFMDSSGIALVLRAHRRMGELGGTLRLSNVPPQAARVLRAARVDKLLPWSK